MKTILYTVATLICLTPTLAAQTPSTPTHWAFVAPVRPTLPNFGNVEWARNPIDLFVLDRQVKEGLRPSPPADRSTLLRRLSLDLTGLPPTLDEINNALSSTDPNWYQTQIEKTLASPHYGERWARHWLDVAQFADSDGFEKDKPRQVTAWRDWVIDALNDNMPYDKFIVHQVAGDRLPNPTQNDLVATGFLRNSMINEEGGIEPEQFRMEAMFNRMDVIGRSVLGLTVNCAQCHTHKYDPLTHTDYYRMLAFLNNTHEANISVYTPAEEKQRAEIDALVANIENAIKKKHPDWRERMAAWMAKAQKTPYPKWQTPELTFDDTSAGGQKCIAQGDGSYLAQGYAPTRFGPKMAGDLPLSRLTAVRLELLTDPNLPRGGPGRSIYGTGALSEFEIRIAPAGTPIEANDQWTKLEIASAIADVNPPVRALGPEFPNRNKDERLTGPIAMAIDGKKETAWTTDNDPDRRNQFRYAIFTLAEPLDVTPGTQIMFTPHQQHGGWNSDDNQNNNLGRFRISITDADALPKEAIPEKVRSLLMVPPSAVSHERYQKTIFDYWRTTVPEFREENARIDALWQAQPTGDTQLVMLERDKQRETHRLERGDFLQPAERVEPGVPDYLHPLRVSAPLNRLTFAQWLVDPKSPTTARAMVNRAWQRFFGEGVISTPSDLGLQGEAPTHPELLDWLAVEFMESGWDVKNLHRLIVTSATYRQSSHVTPAQLEKDPNNRLMARGARFRVEGEIVRDIALAASGLLNPAIGGRSVYPPAPDYLFLPPASYGPKPWHTAQGAQRYRRALYTFRFRSVPYPVLQTFDTPPGDAPCARRDRSNSPLQALTALNEPLFFECAQALAAKALEEGGATDRTRLDYAFLRCVARQPNESEAATLLAFLDSQRDRIASGELDSTLIAKLDEGPPSLELTTNAAELAAWTLTSRILLNLDETIMRQ